MCTVPVWGDVQRCWTVKGVGVSVQECEGVSKKLVPLFLAHVQQGVEVGRDGVEGDHVRTYALIPCQAC